MQNYKDNLSKLSSVITSILNTYIDEIVRCLPRLTWAYHNYRTRTPDPWQTRAINNNDNLTLHQIPCTQVSRDSNITTTGLTVCLFNGACLGQCSLTVPSSPYPECRPWHIFQLERHHLRPNIWKPVILRTLLLSNWVNKYVTARKKWYYKDLTRYKIIHMCQTRKHMPDT